jgi:hypothetical protein
MVTAWRCQACRRPIRAGTGYIEIVGISEDGQAGGYPAQPTLEEAWPVPPAADPPHPWPLVVSAADLLVLGKTQSRIAFRVLHRACDTDPASGYWFDVGRARTLSEWVSRVRHVGAKTWMGRRDILAMLTLWFENRGEEVPDA